eukprot:599544-Pyramimonas_sp.AAC.1
MELSNNGCSQAENVVFRQRGEEQFAKGILSLTTLHYPYFPSLPASSPERSVWDWRHLSYVLARIFCTSYHLTSPHDTSS